MAYYSNDYKERRMNQKSFRVSLIYGVIIGGMMGAAIELFAGSILESNIGIGSFSIAFALLIASLFLGIFAMHKSSEICTSTKIFLFKHPPQKLEAIYKGALDNCRTNKLRGVLENHLALLINEKSYALANNRTLRDFYLEISRAIPSNASGALKSYLKEIQEYPDLLHAVFDAIVRKISSSKIYQENNWTSSIEDDGSVHVNVKDSKGRMRKLFSLKAEKRLDDTLEVPYACFVQVNPEAADEEHIALANALNHLLVEIWTLDEARGVRLEMASADSMAILEQINSEVRDPIIESLNEMFEQLGEVERLFAENNQVLTGELEAIMGGLNRALPNFQE